MNAVKTREELKILRIRFKEEHKKVVFTNGVFDIIHSGHIDYLNKAKVLGEILIVALNSDSSVKKIKGKKRPILNETERALVLSNLKPVDYVTLFDEETPANLIEELIPDVLVKGADWSVDKIIGSDVVLANGGEVKNIEFVNDQSTSKIIETILNRYS
jgi:D-beta-D-heptose 7-phosphate kinase/D-beta-D-heptose 1-phosphate adenosyltransferase